MTATNLTYVLRDYQRESHDSIAKSFLSAPYLTRQLIVLPTGMGKTVILASIRHHPSLDEWLSMYGTTHQKMLVLAHRDELITQAAEKITHINPGLIVEIEKAERKASPMADVIVASVQTLKGKRLLKINPDDCRICVVDEAHHSTSPSYTDILQHLKFLPPNGWGPARPTTGKSDDLLRWQRERLAEWDQVCDKDRLLLGFTATPRRSDNVGLEAVFQDIVYSKTIREGIEEGHLSRLRAIRVLSQTSLDGVSTLAGDFNQGELADCVNTEDRNKLAVKAWLEHAHGRQTIAFCASVAHAHDLAREFREQGIRAIGVSGVTPPQERRDILRMFNTGRVTVLANCQLLTEGFDEPNIQCVLHTKPTKSSIQYIQMTGRGTRLHPDKDDCLVIDVVDVTRRHSLLTAPELFGLPAGFDGKGDDLLNVAKKVDAVKEDHPNIQTSDLRSLDELQMRVEQIDIWTSQVQSQLTSEHAKMTWLQDGPTTFRLALAMTPNTHEHVEISQGALGKWDVTLHTNGNISKLATTPDIKRAFTDAESWLTEHRPHQTILADRMSPWRSMQPTKDQVAHARRLKIPEAVIASAKSRGELSDFIDVAKKHQPKPKFVL